MRVECKVLDVPSSARTGRGAGKGIIYLGTINTPGVNASKPCLSVFTATGRETKYPLDGSCEVDKICDSLILRGQISIIWNRPARTTVISEAQPEILRIFMHKLSTLLRGEQIENHKEMNKKRKCGEGCPVELIVTRRENYPKSFPSVSLKTLVLSGIGLKTVDPRWFNCTHITTLDLSNNLLTSFDRPNRDEPPPLAKMRLIGRLINLQVLNLSHNQLENLPEEIVCVLPPSLLSLDLSFNLFRWIPSLSSIPLLNQLNMANNRLTGLPHELQSRPLLSLNLDNNLIKCLSYIPSAYRRTFHVSGNPLDEAVSTPDLTVVRCPSLLQLAMQSIAIECTMNRTQLDDMYKMRFWREEGIDFCDYCKVSFATDGLFRFVQSVNASSISQQAAFNTSYPTRVVSCRKCYMMRHPPIHIPLPVQPRVQRRVVVRRRI